MGDADLANLSDKLMLTTAVMYIIALVAYAADLGFGRRRAERAAAEDAGAVEAKAESKAKVLVGAATAEDVASGAKDIDAGSSGTTAAADVDDAPERMQLDVAKLAILLNVLGWGAHLATVVTRGLAADRWPWANMYGFLTAISFAAVTAFLIVLMRYKARYLGAFVMAAAIVAIGIANIWLYDSIGPVSPALNSYWIAIHVSAAIIATGAFTVAGAATILYLVKSRAEEKGTLSEHGILARMPSSEGLDRLANGVTMFAFPIWTAAIIMGAIWADQAWGRYWGWDPKEIWSFITWVIYAAYLHARATAGWKGRKAAVLALIAFAALMFNFFGVNYLFSGLHSYA